MSISALFDEPIFPPWISVQLPQNLLWFLVSKILRQNTKTSARSRACIEEFHHESPTDYIVSELKGEKVTLQLIFVLPERGRFNFYVPYKEVLVDRKLFDLEIFPLECLVCNFLINSFGRKVRWCLGGGSIFWLVFSTGRARVETKNFQRWLSSEEYFKFAFQLGVSMSPFLIVLTNNKKATIKLYSTWVLLEEIQCETIKSLKTSQNGCSETLRSMIYEINTNYVWLNFVLLHIRKYD